MEVPEWTGMVEITDQTRKKFLAMECFMRGYILTYSRL